ncbi:MAG: hypothetical protein QXF26_01580, partial [Candidatus Bathyarchaeia archaeon]
IKQRGGASNLQEIVNVMNAVTNRDLSGLFREWGFDVEGIEEVNAVPMIVIWIVLIAVSVILIRRL